MAFHMAMSVCLLQEPEDKLDIGFTNGQMLISYQMVYEVEFLYDTDTYTHQLNNVLLKS